MSKILKFIMMIFICCFFAFGCAETFKQLAQQPAEPAIEINIPDRFFVDNKTTPIDIKMVCAGILNKLRHRGETKFVRFDPIAGQKVQEELFDYEGFDTTLIDITGFEAEIIAKNKVRGVLEGVFHFEDFVGRRASTYFAAEYFKTPDGIMINKAGATNIAPLFPRVEAYFIPVEAFNRIMKNAGYWEMYAFALENSLDMKPTEKEIQAYQAYQNLSTWKKLTEVGKAEKMKLAVMIFCLDRLSNVASFEVVVSENKIENIVEPGYINKDGWPIAVVAGEFAPDYWGATFDINTYYTPEGEDKKILIGRFTNQKDYNPKPKEKQIQVQYDLKQEATPVVEKKVEDKKEKGPVASGSVFLNPSLRSDAKIIQKRLFDLGYYNMEIDGLFGKGSQQAVQKFKKENGLGDNATWDIQTQKILFEDTDL